jgi:hypothetical protein
MLVEKKSLKYREIVPLRKACPKVANRLSPRHRLSYKIRNIEIITAPNMFTDYLLNRIKSTI